MEAKDPEDVDLLALALFLGAPVWSNDDDFKDLPVKRYTTAEFLKLLGIYAVGTNGIGRIGSAGVQDHRFIHKSDQCAKPLRSTIS
jgi:hypothetical protein